MPNLFLYFISILFLIALLTILAYTFIYINPILGILLLALTGAVAIHLGTE
jgi:hypothetical protein